MGDHKHIYTAHLPEAVDLKTLPQRIQEGISIGTRLLEESEGESVCQHLAVFKTNGDARVLVFEDAYGLDFFLSRMAATVSHVGYSPIAELMLISEAWHARLSPPPHLKGQKESEGWVLAERNRLNDIHGSMKDWPINLREECLSIVHLDTTTMWMAQIPFMRDGKTVLMHLDRITAFECEDVHGAMSRRLRALVPLTKKEHDEPHGPPTAPPEAPQLRPDVGGA